MLKEEKSLTNAFNCFFFLFFLMPLLPLLYLKFLIFCIIGPWIINSSPDSLPKNVKNNNDTRTKFDSIDEHLSFVKTQGF